MRILTIAGAAALAGFVLSAMPASAQTADPASPPIVLAQAGDAMPDKPMMRHRGMHRDRMMMHHRMRMMHHKRMMMHHRRHMMKTM